MPTQFELGFLAGLLVGEGHFGGDGRQPHVTLRMHVRHEAIFRWLERTFPGGRVYGPYDHGGRRYLQWMARGPFLRDELAPLLDRWLSPELDRHSFDRFQLMKARYPQLAGVPATDAESEEPPASPGRATPNPPDRHVSASRPDTAAARTDHHPVSRAPAARAEDDRDPDSRSASSSMPTADADPFADLFTQLRESWPP